MILLKPNFLLQPNFEIGSHTKSAFPALQWTCSKDPWGLGGYGESWDFTDLLSKSIGVLEKQIYHEVHFQKICFLG